jgi:peptidoglycan/xylan/chitin deacetylase (PgdA/CDA1 family)
MSSGGQLKQLGAWLLLHSQTLRVHNSLLERGRAILLLYHRVNDDQDAFFPSLPRRSFAAQLDYLAGRYRVEPLDDVVEWLAAGAKGPSRVAITIDDGYPDTLSVALPELERLGLPATLFLSTAPPETGESIWTDRLRWLMKYARARELEAPWLGLPRLSLASTDSRLNALARLLGLLKVSGPAVIEQTLARLESTLVADGPPLRTIGWPDVRRLVSGRSIRLGAHTHRHYPLSRLTDDEQEHEVKHCLGLIQERAGVRVTSFAYPNGQPPDYDARTIGLLRRLGLRCALTTRPGQARSGQDLFELPRIHTSEPSLPVFAARLAGLSLGTRLEAAPA